MYRWKNGCSPNDKDPIPMPESLVKFLMASCKTAKTASGNLTVPMSSGTSALSDEYTEALYNYIVNQFLLSNHTIRKIVIKEAHDNTFILIDLTGTNCPFIG